MAKKKKVNIKEKEKEKKEAKTEKASETPEIEVVEIDPIKALTSQISEEKDKSLRHLAELENFKKRKHIEMESFRKYASEEVIIEFLPLLDSLNMAFLSIEHTEDKNIKYGLELIKKQLETTLDKLKVTPVKAAEKDTFDPNIHQAISQEKSEDHQPGTLIKVMQKGYELNGKIIRPAMVAVAE